MPAPDGSERSDKELMAADEAGAFAQLYDRHAVRALRIARAICHDDGHAEDVVQESFLAIWRSRAKYRPEMGSFQAWAMRIVQNRAIDSLRSAAARPREQPSAPYRNGSEAVSASSQDEAIARSEEEALRASLQDLPEAQAEVITLAFFGGLSHTEIAAQLALPKGTVKGRMRLGLEKLRGQMKAAG